LGSCRRTVPAPDEIRMLAAYVTAAAGLRDLERPSHVAMLCGGAQTDNDVADEFLWQAPTLGALLDYENDARLSARRAHELGAACAARRTNRVCRSAFPSPQPHRLLGDAASAPPLLTSRRRD